MSDKEMMRCEEVQNIIADYSVGNVADKVAEAVEIHLLKCEGCAREFRVLEAAVDMVESVPQLEPPAGMWEAVYAGITETKRAKVPFTERIRGAFFPPVRAMALGFALLVLLVISTFGRINLTSPQTTADSSTREYVQGHVVFASQDAFADRVGLASVTAASMTGEETQ